MGTVKRAAERNPSNSITAGPINFREPAESRAQRTGAKCGHGNEFGVFVHHLVVDFVTENDQMVRFGDLGLVGELLSDPLAGRRWVALISLLTKTLCQMIPDHRL